MPLDSSSSSSRHVAYSKVGIDSGSSSTRAPSRVTNYARKLFLVVIAAFFLFIGAVIFSPQVRWEIYARHYAYRGMQKSTKKIDIYTDNESRENRMDNYNEKEEEEEEEEDVSGNDDSDIKTFEEEYEEVYEENEETMMDEDDDIDGEEEDDSGEQGQDEELNDDEEDEEEVENDENNEEEEVDGDENDIEFENDESSDEEAMDIDIKDNEVVEEDNEVVEEDNEVVEENNEVVEEDNEVVEEDSKDEDEEDKTSESNDAKEAHDQEEDEQKVESETTVEMKEHKEEIVVVDTQKGEQDGAEKSDEGEDESDGMDAIAEGKGESESTGGRQLMTKDFLTKHSSNNRVIVTWANFHYLDFVKNWVYHLNLTGATNFVVGATDEALYLELEKLQMPCFYMDTSLPESDFGWGTKVFHKMGRHKINLVSAVTELGFDLLLSDVDTVWLRDPNGFMDKYPDADVLTSSDHNRMTTTDGGLELFPEAGGSANIGIMLFSKRAKLIGDEWTRRLDENDKLWDQQAFNEIMRQGFQGPEIIGADGVRGERREDRLFQGFDKKALFGILPVSLFCSGHGFFVANMPATINQTAYVVHATFQYGGTPGKRNRFREKLMWDDPEEYFTRPEGYLSFNPDIPDELLNGETSFSLEGHFKLVHHQLKQIRAGLAMAYMLNRALVMPTMYCQYDRFWAPIENGRFAPGPPHGTYFVCPMDHVFDMERMDRAKDRDKFRFDWREYSFLDNPRLPKETLSKAVTISDSKNMTDRAVIEFYGGGSKYKDTQLLKVENILSVFDGYTYFEDEATQAEFEENTKHLTSIWCCVKPPPPPPRKPGHIWYDIWFDKIPHEDRHKRHIETEWTPTLLGP